MNHTVHKRTNIDYEKDCTVQAIGGRVWIPHICIPNDLNLALQNHLIDNGGLSEKCSNYIKCIKSLSNVRRIESRDYLDIFKICLYLEQYELELQMKRYRLTNHKIMKGSLIGYFIISVPSLDSEDPVILPDDTVTLYEVVTKRKFLARVTKVAGKDVTVRLNPFMAQLFNSGKTFDVRFHSSNWSLRCCHYALMLLNKYDLLKLTYPQLKTSCMYLEFEVECINTNISNNKEQKQAVMKILSRMAHPAPYIIFGPPGTGKTATLIEIICQIVRHYPTKNILVCTASNAAADEITIKLMEHVPINIIYRMYAPSRSWDDINKKIRCCANFVNATTPIFLLKEILLLKRIIITTLVTSIRLSTAGLRNDHFSYIIIDEASQATEPEILIPFTLTNRENEVDSIRSHAQVVIAGDPYQLGPVVHCRISQHLLGRSMLERLMNDCDPYKRRDGKYNPNYITKLTKNFRSHEHILYVPNEQFYNNELEICGGADIQMALNWPKLPQKNFPMIFQEVLGAEERTVNRSVYNMAEVLMVMQYVEMLIGTKFGEYTINEKDIGIITPFKEQKIKIIHHLAAKKWEKITVGTVETFQGQERTIIILSTVRSKIFKHDGKKHIGFLSNPKRFNVAMTRAKALMIIIGNPDIISTNEHWKALWEYCNKHDGYIIFERSPLKPNVMENLKNDYIANLEDSDSQSNAANGNGLSITVEFEAEAQNKIKTKTFNNVLVCDMEQLTLKED